METINVLLTNRWAQFRCSPELQQQLKLHFRYWVPGAQFSEKYRAGAWDGYHNLMRWGRVASGLFLAKQSKMNGFEFSVTDRRTLPEFRTAPALPSSRPYQQRAVEAMVSASNVGGIILSATGSGKTHAAALYLQRIAGDGVFIVDELTLLEQSRKELIGVLREPVGVVGKSEFRPHRITVATIQTLHRYRTDRDFLNWYQRLEVMIIDEIHLALNRRNVDVVQLVSPKAVFGLTATLEMEKEHVRLPAIALAGPVIFEYPIEVGVAEGYLSRGVICRLHFEDPLQGRAPGWSYKKGEEITTVRSGSPEADYHYRVTLNKARNDCIEALVREAVNRGRRVIVLVERLAHLQRLGKRLQNVPHRLLCGAYKQEERLAAVQAMDAGEVPLILASRVFGKGVDIKSVNTILDATALPSRNSAIQRYGRGVRRAEGKAGLLYIDIADVGNRFSTAARYRARALQEVKAPIVNITWKKRAEKVFDQMERELEKLIKEAA